MSYTKRLEHRIDADRFANRELEKQFKYVLSLTEDANVLEEFVRLHPDKAIRLFHLTKDSCPPIGRLAAKSIGEEFIKQYRSPESEYHHSAYFIAQELEIPIKRVYIQRDTPLKILPDYDEPFKEENLKIEELPEVFKHKYKSIQEELKDLECIKEEF